MSESMSEPDEPVQSSQWSLESSTAYGISGGRANTGLHTAHSSGLH